MADDLTGETVMFVACGLSEWCHVSCRSADWLGPWGVWLGVLCHGLGRMVNNLTKPSVAQPAAASAPQALGLPHGRRRLWRCPGVRPRVVRQHLLARGTDTHPPLHGAGWTTSAGASRQRSQR